QLPFHVGYIEQGDARAGLELHQQVEVAVIAEVSAPITENRAEGFEVPDRILPAETVDLAEPAAQVLLIVGANHRKMEVRRLPTEDSPLAPGVEQEREIT